ncbi:MAG: ImmA/IrrE family metallo-endopeptidase [Beijerinckiaceae bacterium]|nr:ImmA/IrrE family metallo-endopeptidase [Beijerinckiaceae bacterium]
MIRDYYAPLIAESRIAAIADKWREEGRIQSCLTFNIVDFFVHTLMRRFDPRKGIVHLRLADDLYEKNPAFVSYNPPKLSIHKEIWSDAALGDPNAREIVAHEIGHLILHDQHVFSFQKASDPKLKFRQHELESIEVQAITFADNFLVPLKFVFACRSAADLSRQCEVPLEMALRRLRHLKNRSSFFEYCGESCPECANFTLVRSGTCLKCDTCGSTTGCS